ncbi:MAG TPA: DUF6544 family protein [Labilithrix sp.]|nr:DUF6544 family protein [Labilithrix sp.]
MLRIAVALLLAAHGALHLLGFLQAWQLAAVPALSGRAIVPLTEAMGRLLGVLWLVACVLLVSAAALRLARSDSWWMLGAAGVVLSQALIVVQWHDAKAGTILNVVLAVALLVAGGTSRFHDRAVAEVRAMYGRTPAPVRVVAPQDLAPLPSPVRRWLERSGIVGRDAASTVRLRQRGEMHTANDAPWMPVEAEQYFTVDDPGFVWWMDSRMMKVLPLCGRDKYVAGEGEMLIKAAGLVNVANDRGPKIDQGAMLRYLAEIVWFPSAALRSYIAWEAIDETHATATMTNHGVTASAVFAFDALGRVVSTSAHRYYGASGGLERWGGRITDWRVLRGVEIGARGEVVWQLASGDFTFFRWEIVDVETNLAALYGAEAR